jgi:cell division protein FtsL
LTKKMKLFYILPFFLIILLGITQIYLSNKLATRGRKLTVYEREISLMEEENKWLKSEIASLGCLTKLQLAAAEKKFIKNPRMINLSSKVPVALNPQ